MAPGARDLTVYAGDTYTHTVTAVDGDEVAVDLSDRTWTAQYRTDATATDSVSFTVDATDAATGVLVLTLTAAQTAALTVRTGVWDLQGTYGDGSVETLLSGSVTLNKDVTRA